MWNTYFKMRSWLFRFEICYYFFVTKKIWICWIHNSLSLFLSFRYSLDLFLNELCNAHARSKANKQFDWLRIVPVWYEYFMHVYSDLKKLNWFVINIWEGYNEWNVATFCFGVRIIVVKRKLEKRLKDRADVLKLILSLCFVVFLWYYMPSGYIRR